MAASQGTPPGGCGFLMPHLVSSLSYLLDRAVHFPNPTVSIGWRPHIYVFYLFFPPLPGRNLFDFPNRPPRSVSLFPAPAMSSIWKQCQPDFLKPQTLLPTFTQDTFFLVLYSHSLRPYPSFTPPPLPASNSPALNSSSAPT